MYKGEKVKIPIFFARYSSLRKKTHWVKRRKYIYLKKWNSGNLKLSIKHPMLQKKVDQIKERKDTR